MRTLTLAAATAGLVLLPSAAYAGEPATGAVAAPARLSASCNGAFTAGTGTSLTFVIAASAVSDGGVATGVRCDLRLSSGTHGGVALTAPGPAVAVAGTASAPIFWGPFQLCVSATAMFSDGSTASLPPSCRSL